MSTTADAAAGSFDSTTNLLRLFETQPNHHVITRQDLTRVYDKSHPAVPPSSDGAAAAINHYYTWNSSSTNASIHKYVRVRRKQRRDNNDIRY